MINGIKTIILYPMLIAVSYWITEGLLYPGLSDKMFVAWFVIKSVGLPLISIMVLVYITKKINLRPRDIIVIGCCGVFWIWLLSSCYMPIMNIFIQNKDVNISMKDFGYFILGFPFVAIEISTYSGGLLGLLLATIGLPITAIIMAKKKKF
jgi:hypothetical protein